MSVPGDTPAPIGCGQHGQRCQPGCCSPDFLLSEVQTHGKVGVEKFAVEQSASHLGAAVAYASVADVDTVVVDGILRKSGGELVGVDRAARVRDAEASRDRLLGQIGTSTEELRFSGQIALQQQ